MGISSQERHVHLLCHLAASSKAEDIDALFAVRANEADHILHNAKHTQLHVFHHVYGFLRVQHRNLMRHGYNYRCC
jgi:hypothetical protein